MFIFYAFGFLRFIRIIEIFGVLFIVFQTMMKDVAVFIVLYALITLGFGGAMNFVAGHEVYGYRSFSWSL